MTVKRERQPARIREVAKRTAQTSGKIRVVTNKIPFVKPEFDYRAFSPLYVQSVH